MLIHCIIKQRKFAILNEQVCVDLQFTYKTNLEFVFYEIKKTKRISVVFIKQTQELSVDRLWFI